MGEKFDEAEIRPLRRKPSHYLLKPEERVTFSRYFFEKWVSFARSDKEHGDLEVPKFLRWQKLGSLEDG
jgi:hypothetical protein